jgi:uncharacterized protein (TIGR02246 family)
MSGGTVVTEQEREVLEAVGLLVRAFAEGRLEDYFDSFVPDATFVFYTASRRLMSVEEYRELWGRWVSEDGFRVLSCKTSDTLVQLFGNIAVVTHTVETNVSTTGGTQTLHERETIVLTQNEDGRWLAVHEHLSPMPEGDAS